MKLTITNDKIYYFYIDSPEGLKKINPYKHISILIAIKWISTPLFHFSFSVKFQSQQPTRHYLRWIVYQDINIYCIGYSTSS